MQMEKPNTNTPPTPSVPSMPPSGSCQPNQGTLPGTCAPMVFPFVAMQEENPVRYSRMANTALVELMALDFAIDELGLYLTTHAQDQEALQLYWSYIKLAKEGREKYQKMYGPLLQTDLTPEDGFAWLKDPWPWEEGGND